jgi:ATP-dependent DNA helicase DinG
MTNPEGGAEESGFDLLEGLRAAARSVGGIPRPGQEDMARAVAEALARREHLLVQAGTGTGKSLAYLVPAFAHAVVAGPVIVATATLALQRQLIERDIPAISEAVTPLCDRPVRGAVLKGRHHYLCQLRLSGADATDASARDAADNGGFDEAMLWDPGDAGGGRLTQQAAAVREWAKTTSTGDRDDLPEPVDSRVWRAVSVTATECLGRSKCPFAETCFSERARDAARLADVVVTNHAMLAIELVEGIPVLPDYDGIIIDEGHEWIDRATQAATLSVSSTDIDAVAAALRRAAPKAASRFADASRAWDASVSALRSPSQDVIRLAGDLGDRPVAVSEAMTTLRAAARAALGDLLPPDPDAQPGHIAARQRLRARLDELIEVADRYLCDSDAYVLWVAGRPATLRVAPLSIAGHLGQRLASKALVVTSATLGPDARTRSDEQPFGGLARALGIEAGPWRGLNVGSPFDYERQGILYVASALPEPGRDGLDEAVLDEIAELIEAAGGRTLVLLSSWRGVDRTAAYLPVRLGGDIPVLVQQRGDPVGPLVDSFRSIPESVLVATVSLWQGIDVPGDACRLVVIDKIPFTPPDDPVLAARADRVAQRGGSGFAEVALPRAAMLLAQGVGRLIRSRDDRGVVAICDPRMVTKGYGRYLRDALPPLWFTTDGHLARAALRRLSNAAESIDD